MWSPLLRPDAGALAAREEALEAMVEACTAKPRRPTGRPGGWLCSLSVVFV